MQAGGRVEKEKESVHYRGKTGNLLPAEKWSYMQSHRNSCRKDLKSSSVKNYLSSENQGSIY